jgi:hypothetical protein
MEISDEEYREKAAANVWGGETKLFEAPVKEEKVDVKEEEVEPKKEEVKEDPFADIDPAVKSFVESQLGEVNNLKYRLQQAEKRVGSLQNALQNKKEEKPVEKKPPEPVVNEEWEKLKAEYPEDEEKFSVMEKMFAGKTADNLPKAEDIEKIREELQTDFNTRLTQSQLAAEAKLLSIFHPDYKTVGSSPEYSEWLKVQDPEIQEKAHSYDAVDAKYVLDLYKKPKEKPASTQEKRDKRLSRATETPRVGKGIQNKSVDDMTDDEYREIAAQKYFGKR